MKHEMHMCMVVHSGIKPMSITVIALSYILYAKEIFLESRLSVDRVRLMSVT